MNAAAIDISLLRNISCTSNPQRKLSLHLLLPEPLPLAPLPVLVWIFGGAFLSGSKNSGIAKLVPMVERGYCGVAIEHRFSSEAHFPAQLHDCKTAIRFLRKYSANFSIDPDRIGVWGASSGGNLAALLGVTGDSDDLEGDGGWSAYSSSVQAVCDFYGPTDFLQMDRSGSTMVHDAADSPESLLIGGPIQDYPERAARANPISYLAPERRYPPFLIVHGDSDPLVPCNQSALLAAALQQVDADVQLQVLSGAGHGGPEFESAAMTQVVGDFFDRHLHATPPGMMVQRVVDPA